MERSMSKTQGRVGDNHWLSPAEIKQFQRDG